jgi:hypothetical protein
MSSACKKRVTEFPTHLVGRNKARLFFEEILEGFARVVGPGGAGSRRLFLNSDAHGIERTLVALVFARDALRDWLTTFEAAGGIEICTLPTGVQFETALWAAAGRLGSRRQQGSALGATGYRVRSRHVDGAWPKRILLDRLLTCGFLPFLAAVLISALTVFAV